MRFGRLAPSIAGVLLLVAGPARGQAPWEFWKGPHVLPLLSTGDQVVMRSSYCPSGCRYDRTSEGDTRFLRIDGDEQVILEETGPGAITRIWMTAGAGVSQPLDASVRIRIRVDGADAPVVDLPLPNFFSGNLAPFVAPLVAGRELSSGGNVSYVPIPYRTGCRVSLVGALAYRLWFQFNLHRLAEAGDVATFTGLEDNSPLASLLASPGADPWPGAGVTASGSWVAQPPVRRELFRLEGPGTVTALRVKLPLPWGEGVVVRLEIDGNVRAEMPASDLFALGSSPLRRTKSLLVGIDDEGFSYLYFPMPFRQSLAVTLDLPAEPPSAEVAIPWEVRVDRSALAATAGTFGAHLTDVAGGAGRDLPLLDRGGRGKWVGLFGVFGSGVSRDVEYLEGDERVFVDGSPYPALHGTGTEDLFNGGFYFDRGPFGLPLHGCLDRRVWPDGEERTAAYRLLLLDAVPWTSSIRASLEAGPTGLLSIRARTVAYVYEAPVRSLAPVATIDLGDPESLTRHGYTAEGSPRCEALTSGWPSDDPAFHTVTSCRRASGASRFRVAVPPDGFQAFRLRRRLDAGFSGQGASVSIDGVVAGRFPPLEENGSRRLREVDLALPAVPAGRGEVEFTITPDTSWGTEFSEIRWEILGSPTGNPLSAFFVTPCRAFDTRRPDGIDGGPAIQPQGSPERAFPLAGICGVPSDAKAVMANVTVTGAQAAGSVTVYPADLPAAPGSSNVAFPLGRTRAASSILLLGGTGDGMGKVKVWNGSAGALHLVVDVSGYFR